MTFLEQSYHWFRSQSRSRQISLMISAVLIITMTTYFIVWALSPRYGVLFRHMDNRDASKIIAELEKANISYELRENGQSIYIDQALIDKTRIKLMSNPLQLNQSVGFELFDKNDFGMTDFSQKINYQRALQGELERTITSLDEVQQARVQLSIPEHHLFQDDQSQPSAAVTLHLNHPLSKQQINSIRQLITASVPHLNAKKVIMLDQNSHALTGAEDDDANAHFTAKKKVEHYLTNKVMQLLHPIFMDTSVMVKIDVTLNYDELQRERINPQHDSVIRHEKATRHSNAQKTDKKSTNQDYTTEKSYEFGQEKEQFIRASGTIERLTISVVVPQHTSSEKIQQIKRLVKSVVGFDENRGDTISIEALVTEPVNQLPFTTHKPKTTSISTSTYLLWGLTGLSSLALLAGGVRFRLRKKRRQLLLAELNAWLNEHG